MENSGDGQGMRTEVKEDEDIYTAAVRQRERNDARGGNGGRGEKNTVKKKSWQYEEDEGRDSGKRGKKASKKKQGSRNRTQEKTTEKKR